ncbi:glucose-6-phosphate isomerase family protein [Micromonospora sagamiensis]|uniref:glucose-6-phosphate isomerase n=1 Tax=Micromonospora sagamiensis TaxID=47875 RepID=A0A562WED2_9ACTN|nr:glucose-6-phosphate isomerase family protein [Micromonospora sagamiensis]TWJ28401.1 glucose-6-phosphate isomerase [Micromonospora sagamiensis]BCL12707.1 glucose-6-phosphate isomerase [Micromonospora sagamiensis]
MVTPQQGPGLVITPEGMVGRTGRYEKRLADLGGLFADEAAFTARLTTEADRVIYHVDEFRPSTEAGDLITGISTLSPGRVGTEFHMTRGHIHAQQDRTEIYHCLSGHGLMLMETLDGRTVVTEMRPGVVAYVPPVHIHRSVNLGDTDLVTLFCYPADAGQDYDIIARSSGMRHRVVADGDDWRLEENGSYVPR